MEQNASGPQFLRFVIPILDILKTMGGSGKPHEVTDQVIAHLQITEVELLETLKSGTSRVRNQIAWARFYLARANLLDASKRGQWQLTTEGANTQLSDEDVVELFRRVQSQLREAESEWALEKEIQQAEYEISDAELWESMSHVNYWWIQQGQLYNQEQQGGYIWMSNADNRSSRGNSTHVMEHLHSGDLVFHQVDDNLVATSVVLEPAEVIQTPVAGWHVKAHYYPLNDPIQLGQLNETLKTELAPLTQPAEHTQLQTLDRNTGELLLEHIRPDYLRERARVWLLQVDIKRHNLAKQLKQHKVGDIATWSLTQPYHDIRPGDLLMLWQSGDTSGLHALGGVVSEVFEQAEGWGVHYRYIHILRPPVMRADCLKHPLLKNLQVLHSQHAERCRITAAEWYAFKALIYPTQQTVAITRHRTLTLPAIHDQLQRQGMVLSSATVRRYHLALQSRGLVILAGVSGVGKTWLAESYAEAIDARRLLVPVAPNWQSHDDLFGYFNPLTDQYQDTPASRFIREAAMQYEQQGNHAPPYHLILDEMNLARVEFYFAQFLSVMECRARGKTAQLQLGKDTLNLPPNLFIIGTVNMDETTQSFADKVYDRAQVLELSVNADELQAQLHDQPYQSVVMNLWRALWPVAPFAFRTVSEMKQYIQAAALLDIRWQTALDEQIVQKILPRVRGSDSRLLPALNTVLELAEQHGLSLTQNKVSQMLDNLRIHGLTSYFA